MRYEIITDKADLLVLVVNSRVVAISSEMSEILKLITEDYDNHRNKIRRVSEEALIYPELDTNTEPIKEDKPVTLQDLIDMHEKKPDDGSIGKLFGL